MNRLLVTCLVVLLGSTAYAQEYKDAKHLALGGPTSFYRPKLTDSLSLQKLATTQGGDIRTVLNESGLGDLNSTVFGALANAPAAVQGGSCADATPQDGVLVECDMTPGTTIEWMAHRPNARKGNPAPQRLLKLRWAGTKNFRAFLFRVTQDGKVYIFIVPKDCGNLSLLSVKTIPAPPVVIPYTPEPPVVVVPPPPAPHIEEPYAPAPPVVIPPILTPEPVKKTSPFFFDILGGKDRRTRHADTLTTTDGHAVTPNGVVDDYTQCSPLLGLKFGVAKRYDNQWEVAGTVGVALSIVTDSKKVRQNEYFTDFEVNKYTSKDGGFVGTGITFWDVTHKDTWAPGVLVHGGVPAGKHAYLMAEGRVFFDQMGDIPNNYQVWGGLRIH